MSCWQTVSDYRRLIRDKLTQTCANMRERYILTRSATPLRAERDGNHRRIGRRKARGWAIPYSWPGNSKSHSTILQSTTTHRDRGGKKGGDKGLQTSKKKGDGLKRQGGGFLILPWFRNCHFSFLHSTKLEMYTQPFKSYMYSNKVAFTRKTLLTPPFILFYFFKLRNANQLDVLLFTLQYPISSSLQFLFQFAVFSLETNFQRFVFLLQVTGFQWQ